MREPDLLGLGEFHTLGAGHQDLGDDVWRFGVGARRDRLAAQAHDLRKVLFGLAVGGGGVFGDTELAHRARHRPQQVILPELRIRFRGAEQPHGGVEYQRQGDVLGEIAAAALAQGCQQPAAPRPICASIAMIACGVNAGRTMPRSTP